MPNPRQAPHAFQHSLVTCHGKNLFASNDPLTCRTCDGAGIVVVSDFPVTARCQCGGDMPGSCPGPANCPLCQSEHPCPDCA